MEKRVDVITESYLQRALGLKGVAGRFIARRIFHLLEIDEVNRIQNLYADKTGPAFSEAVLKEVGVSFELDPAQLDRIPREGGFITVSNHHFGSLDGMILSQVVGGIRPDYRIMTTFLLSQIPSLKDSFLPVDNFSSGGARSVKGIRMALEHIAAGGALGLFPAGEVATWQNGRNRTSLKKGCVVEDIPWADNMTKLIKRSGLPVIPIYFQGGNSRSFHILGKIHPRLRTVRLIHEVFNKRGTVIKVQIGQPIQPAEMASYDIPALGKYLRNRCYALEERCLPRPEVSRMAMAEPVAPREDPQLVMDELDAIRDRIVFEKGDYRCYITKPDDIPHTMRELARLREEVFRTVGEGTGKPLDTDRYDPFYEHLILWHIPNREIAGSYRIGVGSKLMATGGVGAFYTASLLRYEPDAGPLLARCLELGRTIVTLPYQREVLPLKLLLTGLAFAAMQHPEAEYYLGPVSISGECPDFYKSLVVHYLRKVAPWKGQAVARPTHPFTPDFLSVDPDGLLSGFLDSIDKVDALDRLVSNLSNGTCRLPVLVRKYFKCSAKIVDFNVDPDFNNSLDGLILLKMKDFPETTLRSLVNFLPEEQRKAVFHHFGRTTA